TGPLHMGGVRTALFNYLFARKNGGDFLLRIEDTDQTRYVPGAEQYIIDSLRWCGLLPDEGPGFGGNFGPYRQSERKEIYARHANQLIDSGCAYYAFDTPEELDRLRTQAEAEGRAFAYGPATRMQLHNSLSLPAAKVQSMIDAGEPFAVRFKMPESLNVTGEDLIRGSVTFNTHELDDKVLFKSDGMPTYHLANVVDDHLMEITHVIRGEEWLPSMPLHILLYRAFGWEDSRPYFAHLPLILKPQGKGKLSKRDGDKLGFPVFPLQWEDPQTGDISRGYREYGYFPEAFLNMLALLGWNPGTEQEIFSLPEMIDLFSLDRVVKSGSRFDPEKAQWFNRAYLQQKSSHELAKLFMPMLESKNIETTEDKVVPVVEEIKDRCDFVADIWDNGFYFFESPKKYDEITVAKRWKPETFGQLTAIAALFETAVDWKAVAIKEIFSAFMNEKGWNFGAVMNPLRLSLVGGNMGPDLFRICELLGKDETVARIKTAVDTIKI
ncbi:MAG: glutamate--tRNA ligase, partial [Prolixibacteraceae bacterium]|nr:glutamate--tRNA ligase [Prolixibacteraceae bacterium]